MPTINNPLHKCVDCGVPTPGRSDIICSDCHKAAYYERQYLVRQYRGGWEKCACCEWEDSSMVLAQVVDRDILVPACHECGPDLVEAGTHVKV